MFIHLLKDRLRLHGSGIEHCLITGKITFSFTFYCRHLKTISGRIDQWWQTGSSMLSGRRHRRRFKGLKKFLFLSCFNHDVFVVVFQFHFILTVTKCTPVCTG